MKQLTLAKANQEGVGLLEALVAVALSAIVILGAVYSTSKILVSQQENNLHYIVVNELRNKLQTATKAEKAEWCKTNPTVKPFITLPGASAATEITVVCGDVTLTVTGNTANPSVTSTFTEQQPIKFEVQVPKLGGKVTVGEAL